MAKAKAPPKRKVNGYKMPDPLPAGEILQDLFKNQWRLGVSIGKGGFGEIYSAQPLDGKKNSKYDYVIKIEPHANGPLFVEINFYCRNAKIADINAYKSSKNLTNLGMPRFVGSGSHEFKGDKYRFVVMEKFGSDIWKLYMANNMKFPPATAYKLGLQMVDVLEYIHSKGYVHADIKGANILLSLADQNQAYLVDFGLAGRFTTEATFKPNPKKMHDGTIEYLSRDAHHGVQTRRGDIEILAYNIIHWLGGTLPWEKNLKDPKVVQAGKEKFMSDIPLFLKTSFETSTFSDYVSQLLKHVNSLQFNEEPDYEKIRNILHAGVKDSGGTAKSGLIFKSTNKRKSLTENVQKKAKVHNTSGAWDEEEGSKSDSDDENELKPTSRKLKKQSDNVNSPSTRSGTRKLKIDSSTPSENVPKRRGRKPKASTEEEDEVVALPKVVVPRRRINRAATVSTVDETGIIHNTEMMRIKSLSLQKVAKKVPARKRVTPRLNKSLDIISASDDEEILPISRRKLNGK